MTKYPFGKLAVGESAIVSNVKLSAAHVRLHYFRVSLRQADWPADELPSFQLIRKGTDVLITRLPDGARLPPGRKARTAADRSEEARLRAGLSPLQWRAQCEFAEWEERFAAGRVLPSRAMLDLLLEHAPHLHTQAIELSCRPLVYRDLDTDEQRLHALAQRRTAQAQQAIRCGDDPHDAAFLLSLRRVTNETLSNS